jgi:V/A-type H+/Na+-transporting ATPase subunit D
MKFQYNKTALQELDKHLKMRVRALPTIKNKEAALRVEVKRAKDETADLENKLKLKLPGMKNSSAFGANLILHCLQ